MFLRRRLSTLAPPSYQIISSSAKEQSENEAKLRRVISHEESVRFSENFTKEKRGKVSSIFAVLSTF